MYVVHYIKGVIWCYRHFYKLFELKCVCKQPPFNDTNPPSFFLCNLFKCFPLSQIEPSVHVTSHGRRPLPRLLIDSLYRRDYSHLLSGWRGLRLVLKGMHPPIYLNASVHANHSWSSFTYRRSEFKCFLNESLQTAFPNSVLISKFHDECG